MDSGCDERTDGQRTTVACVVPQREVHGNDCCTQFTPAARRDATKQFCRVGSGGVNLVWLSVRLRVLAKHLDDRRVVSMVRRGLRVGVGAKGLGLNE